MPTPQTQTNILPPQSLPAWKFSVMVLLNMVWRQTGFVTWVKLRRDALYTSLHKAWVSVHHREWSVQYSQGWPYLSAATLMTSPGHTRVSLEDSDICTWYRPRDKEVKPAQNYKPWHCSQCPSGLWVSPHQPSLIPMLPCFSLPDFSLWVILVFWVSGLSPQQDISFIRAKWWPTSSTAGTHSLEDSWLLYTDQICIIYRPLLDIHWINAKVPNFIYSQCN
jgi:hypothetical protein